MRFRELGVVINDIAADQFSHHGAYKDIRREMIQPTYAGEADGCSNPYDPNTTRGLSWYSRDITSAPVTCHGEVHICF